MGKIVTVEYVDDLDEVPVDPEVVDIVEFSIRGKDYSLVLNAENAAEFDKDMARWVTAAKKAQAREARAARKKAQPARRPAKAQAAPRAKAKAAARKPTARKATLKSAAPDPQRAKAIRQWARDNGHAVSARGRISAAVIAAYDADH
ncbi:Lsr2 family protein [Mycolicibacterium wolinskyi]|uniref:Lsr2 family protein n=1 Tax=Mycolicibacterium wolinskyi TaxID=59750 RepID=A0A1X2FKF4_9MYCO|nr:MULTISPECIES: Lsr2 family protein [Mycolicibacterium]MCV7286031.1 Lsr2 family protein [Mycolicibacterium wolinskyi]MCV7296227.1 Lsr2 family protein [Mycolicibacterium goodii]ORX18459.1 hypothetical protein AWC31_14240 [Mycolicibacterium wolinskyi]